MIPAVYDRGRAFYPKNLIFGAFGYSCINSKPAAIAGKAFLERLYLNNS
jgi:hypothetical protein